MFFKASSLLLSLSIATSITFENTAIANVEVPISYQERYEAVDKRFIWTSNIDERELIEFAKLAVSTNFELGDDKGYHAILAMEAVNKRAIESEDVEYIKHTYYSRLKLLEEKALSEVEKNTLTLADAMMDLYRLYSLFYLENSRGRDMVKAEDYLTRACKRTSVPACTIAGNNYFYGRKFDKQDFRLALTYYSLAIHNNNYQIGKSDDFTSEYTHLVDGIRKNRLISRIYTSEDSYSIIEAIKGYGALYVDQDSGHDLIELAARRAIIAMDGNKEDELRTFIYELESGGYGYVEMVDEGVKELKKQL